MTTKLQANSGKNGGAQPPMKLNANAKGWVPKTQGKGQPQKNGNSSNSNSGGQARPQNKKKNQKTGSAQVDIRWAKPLNKNIVSNSLKINPITTIINPGAIAGVSIEYVSRAIQHGFLAVVDQPNKAYGAANWIYQTLNNAIIGSTPKIQNGPKWLVQLCKCLSRKQARLAMGQVSYTPALDVTPNSIIVPELPVGPSQYGYEYAFTVPNQSGATPVDGFPVADIATLPGDFGEDAWQQLVQFNSDPKNQQEGTIPFSTEMRAAEKMTSTFAVNFDNMGGGMGATGGYWSLCGAESPVFAPILSAFGASGDDEEVPPSDRVANYSRRTSGDSLLMTNMVSQVPIHAWEIDRPVHLHSIDFMEFGTVLASWSALLVTNFLQDPSNVTTVDGQITDQSLACPLTLQEFLLLLRNEMMMMFKDSQTSVQSLYPLQPTSLTDNQFVAFLASASSCSISGSGIKLPITIVENMRALTARWLKFGKKSHQVEYWWPVLGKYLLDQLSTADYTFQSTIGGTTHSFPVFTTAPQVSTKTYEQDGKEKWAVGLEAPIDLVDGYCSSASRYVFINSTTRLGQLAQIWNQWVVRFEKYADPLITVGTENGPSALSSIGMTRHWSAITTQGKQRKEAFRDPRLKQVSGLMVTPYESRLCVTDTSQDDLIAPLYESILSNWILPTHRFQTGIQPGNRGTLQQYITQFSEPFSKVRSADGVDSLTMAAIHTGLALKMTKGSTSGKNDWIQAFEQALAI